MSEPLAGAALRAAPDVDNATRRRNMRVLIQLRWIAAIGQLVTIELVGQTLDLALPTKAMASVVALLIGFNLASWWRWRHGGMVSERAMLIALLVDVAALTAQLYMSGGTDNPFAFLYLLQVTIGAVLLRPLSSWVLLVVAVLGFVAVSSLHLPLRFAGGRELGVEEFGRLYTHGLIVCFTINASLLVIFLTRISRNLRRRDSRLADLRQRAAEEEHIVRMGLLASGAAHELGTPLATLAVILGDWRRMPTVRADGGLSSEVEEMQAQVDRCKNILSGILMSAGEARADAPVETTVRRFLGEVVAEWRKSRPAVDFAYANRFGTDVEIISDSALKQMIHNVLDNALEASPEWIGLEVGREGPDLVLKVTDVGPGFPDEMLDRFGKPYQSSKGRPGGGLGLFLVVNVARTLGGTVSARNLPERGAIVTLTLPLSALTPEVSDHDESS